MMTARPALAGHALLLRTVSKRLRDSPGIADETVRETRAAEVAKAADELDALASQAAPEEPPMESIAE